ncbi:hypothetical protein R1sor_019196 [Riccia sorocarpa]|uniref:DUF7869 domain-containing protein n=1 Tax=Riccia sorocarpa TaxID=122646 RepID=A0ABD3IF52_9MARC
MKVLRRDLGLSHPRLFPQLTASIKRQRLRFLASMSPPRNVFTNFPSPRLLQSPPNLGVQEQNTQDEDEELGPFETKVFSDDEGYRSNEVVPVSTSARRFKETLRELKPPRFKQHSHAKSHSGEVDTDFVLSKLTPECLSRDHRQFCCTKTCVWNLGIKMLRHEPEAIEALQLHRKQQAEERAAAGRRRWKALDTPKDCAYIQIDGMDQKKTALPHFSKQLKFVDGAALVGVHLMGAMVFHGKMQTRAFLTYNNIKSDSNLTITVLHKILLEWEGPLPPTLYLQLYNTVRENKNNILFAYLAMLLDRNIFTKIKLGFLLVGHTHDFVDQMFSRFSQALRRENAFTMSRLRSVIQNNYDPKPITSVILQTWDFKNFIETEPKLFRTLNDITHNQQYKFKLASTLDVRLWCKQFSTDQTWEPPADVKNFVNADGARMMLASQQLPLKSYAEIKRQTKRAQNIGTLETAQEGDAVRHVHAIRQDIQAHCYPFFDDALIRLIHKGGERNRLGEDTSEEFRTLEMVPRQNKYSILRDISGEGWRISSEALNKFWPSTSRVNGECSSVQDWLRRIQIVECSLTQVSGKTAVADAGEMVKLTKASAKGVISKLRGSSAVTTKVVIGEFLDRADVELGGIPVFKQS